VSLSVEQWEQYYRQGALATGPVGRDGSYDLEVKALWMAFFQGLSARARVLDIATGGGVIAGIALEASRAGRLDLEIHGSDLARIEPHKHDAQARLQGIHFHPGVATEALPMQDSTFDAVCGQYALEYSALEPALKEIHRVLKPDGRALFVVHHHESALVQNALNGLREGQAIVHTAALYRKLGGLLGLQSASQEVAQMLAQQLQQAIRDVKALHAQALAHGSGHFCAVALDTVHALLRAHGSAPPVVLAQEAERAEGDLIAAMLRMQDLVQVAQSEPQMDALVRLCHQIGLAADVPTLLHHDKNNLVAWVLRLQKTAPLLAGR
jgi:SAM-dependent methyltransferase